ncbi:MAG: vWA domain-containing protein [Pseudanabaenaceae cyanobacterium SKYGB_i_bin29]|nr:VWA domain-containing protein [Pseudanabaenaceae cyanobacterium SKYG29]MDW8422074.1 vWA domain-containing protein [Pseudanabaenaceae cyanobacterium SKYGB_i_bin29]
MVQDYTHISIILDRTGSMQTIRDDVIRGFNTFLSEQQRQGGNATLTLVQFDSQNPYEVIHHFKPIKDVPKLDRKTYVPRASTPLYDTIGRGINDLEQSLARLAAEGAPSKVMMVIITDGYENASQEFTRAQVAKMIREKQEKDRWEFIFLSATLESMQDVQQMGVSDDTSLIFASSSEGQQRMWTSLSRQTSKYRSGEKKKFSFDEEDRQDTE